MISILYVDDEPGMLDIGKLFLERGGQFSVDIITSAPAALTLLDSKKYDAVIADYQMPEMDGIEFLKRVRASGNTIPFILFTGKGREEIVIQALNAGADFYLSSPSSRTRSARQSSGEGPRRASGTMSAVKRTSSTSCLTPPLPSTQREPSLHGTGRWRR